MPPQVNLQQIADAAGVHRSTASRALSPKYRDALSPELVLKVKAAAEELGYSPNVFAASLRTRRSKLVGVLLPDIASPIFSLILSGITAQLADEGMSALLMVGDADAALEQSVQHLLALQVEGVIMATARTKDSYVSWLLEKRVPVVLAHRRETQLRTSAVVSDTERGVAAVIEHLSHLGHRDVGLIVGPQNHSPSRQRVVAFKKEAAARGIAIAVAVREDWSNHAGRAGAVELLSGDQPPTAIFAGNDMLAFGVYEELMSRGLNCPRDISVVGYNDMPFSGLVSPALTTVHVDHVQLGRRVASRLLTRIRDNSAPPDLTVMPVQLRIRGSTAAAPR
jgi:LacI family transcriptional regulator